MYAQTRSKLPGLHKLMEFGQSYESQLHPSLIKHISPTRSLTPQV